MKRSLAWATLAIVSSVLAGCSSSPTAPGNTIENRGPTGGSSVTTPSGGTGGTGGAPAAGGTGASVNAGGLFSCSASQFTGLTDCGTAPVEAQVVPVQILILLDKSATMRYGFLSSSQTKWEALLAALGSALPQLEYYARFGLELFPAADVSMNSPKSDNCRIGSQPDIAIDDGTKTVPEILALLDPSRTPVVSPGGSTPTAAALAVARQYFQTHPISVEPGATQTGKQLIFLITDGGPNCNANLSCGLQTCTTNLDHAADPQYQPTVINWCDTDPNHDGPTFCLDNDTSIQELTNLKTAGVGTVVIGMPGSEPYQAVLNAMADAGGQVNTAGPQHFYQVNNSPDQLTQIFRQTATQLITSCNIFLEQKPPDPTKVNVAVDCAVVPQTDGSGQQQWSIDTSTTPAKLVLEGALCDRAKQSGLGRVDVLLGCPSVN
jgi:hypothetical protein